MPILAALVVLPIKKIDDDPAKFGGRVYVHPVACIWNRKDLGPRKEISDPGKIALLNVIRVAASDEANRSFEDALRFYRLAERVVVSMKSLEMHPPLKAMSVADKVCKQKLSHSNVGNVLLQC